MSHGLYESIVWLIDTVLSYHNLFYYMFLTQMKYEGTDFYESTFCTEEHLTECFGRFLGFLNLISQKIASEKRAGLWFQVHLEPWRKQTKNTFKNTFHFVERSVVYLSFLLLGTLKKIWLVKGYKFLGIAWAVQILPAAWQRGKMCRRPENLMVHGKNEIFLKLMVVFLSRPVHQTSMLFLHYVFILLLKMMVES